MGRGGRYALPNGEGASAESKAADWAKYDGRDVLLLGVPLVAPAAGPAGLGEAALGLTNFAKTFGVAAASAAARLARKASSEYKSSAASAKRSVGRGEGNS